MTLHLHHLTGCAPAPLAHYLKALGILRIVAEQADPNARGWWQDEHFCLLTKLDRDALETCFLDDYAPTPFVSPWNRGSGFYAAKDKGLAPIEASIAPRLAAFREGIAASRALLEQLNEADGQVRALKATTKAQKGMTRAEQEAARARKDDPEFKRELAAAERRFKELKSDLFRPCDLAWRGPHRSWMEAALVLPESGAPIFASLLGTGGNDGRLDFTNNAMQRLGEMFDLETSAASPRPHTQGLLREALWRLASDQFASDSIGQFLPGAAGGANSTTGSDGPPHINPWDFILMMEGTLLFTSRITRRLGSQSAVRASAPFAIRAHPVGHGSAGGEKAERGEQWLPLWSAPTTLSDLSTMLGEARMQVGRDPAQRPLDVAVAVSRLGVARGISEFVRIGYLERNGQSNLAVPLGRVRVRENTRARLLDDLLPWLERLQRAARDNNTPARLVRAERWLADQAYDAALHHDESSRWQSILLAAVAVEEVQVGGTGTRPGPIPPLSPGWLTACDDGSVEWRLAMALGSAAARYERTGRAVDPIRPHWLPLTRDGRRYDEREKRLVKGPRIVMTGRDAIGDCIALVERRLVEATSVASRRLPLVAALGYEASAADLAQVLAGSVDLPRVVALARALMAVRWSRTPTMRPAGSRHDFLDEGWIALRLAHLAGPLDRDRTIATDDAIIRRLDSGDATSAVELALRRLRTAGLRPPLVAVTALAETARLWAAAMAFPISRATARTMARRFAPSNFKENR